MFIVFSAVGLVFLIIFGACIGFYQATLYINTNTKYLVSGIFSLIISLILFYYAYVEFNNIWVETDKIEARKEIN